MIDSHHSIEQFIQQVESTAGKKFFFPDEFVRLFETVLKSGKQQAFKELLFYASALTKTQDVMKRIGPGAEGYEKLSAEFQSNVLRVAALIREIMGKTEYEQAFENQFLVFETESFLRLTRMCFDLRLIKNWEVDGNPLPTAETIAIRQSATMQTSQRELQTLHRRTKRSLILVMLLLILVAFIDPPATVLGWCVTITVLGLLAYISFLIEEILKQRTEKK